LHPLQTVSIVKSLDSFPVTFAMNDAGNLIVDTIDSDTVMDEQLLPGNFNNILIVMEGLEIEKEKRYNVCMYVTFVLCLLFFNGLLNFNVHEKIQSASYIHNTVLSLGMGVLIDKA